MLAQSLLQRDGTVLGNFMISCDSYQCKLTPITVEKRETSGNMVTITGIAATPKPVDRVGGITETFPGPILERDGKTLIGKPLIDWHSEWPSRVRIKDIIGQVTDTWWDEDRQALMFKAIVWNQNAIEVLSRKMMVHFSPGYGALFDTDNDGNRTATQIEFDHLGHLNRPADEGAELLSMAREAVKGMRTEIEPLDLKDSDYSRAGDNELIETRCYLKLGYDYAREHDDKWGSFTVNDITESNKSILAEMGNRGIDWSIDNDLDKLSTELLYRERTSEPVSILIDMVGIGRERLGKILDRYENKTRMVEKIGDAYCVVHGHDPDPDNPQDKPIGTPIACFSIDEYGEEDAKKKANGLHYIITHPEEARDALGKKVDFMTGKDDKGRANGDGPYAAGPGGMCVCPKCGYEQEHERNQTCTEIECPKCGAKMERKLDGDNKPDERDTKDQKRDEQDVKSPDSLNQERTGETMPDEKKGETPNEKPKEDKAPEGNDKDQRDDQGKKPEVQDDAKPPVDDTKEPEKKDAKPEETPQDSKPDTPDTPSENDPKTDLDTVIDQLREKDPNAEALKLLEQARESLKKKPEPEPKARELDDPKAQEIKELREEVEKHKKAFDEMAREAHEKTVNHRVDSLLNDKKYLPGQREELSKLVGGMTDEQFEMFGKLNEGREMFSTEDLGVMHVGQRATDKKPIREKEKEKYEKYCEEHGIQGLK